MDNISSNYKISTKTEYPKNCYRLIITSVYNFNSEITHEQYIPEEKFKNDILFQYVLAYVGKGYSGKFARKTGLPYYGCRINKNQQFSWLYDYCVEHNLIGKSPIDKYPTKSIKQIKMTYFDNDSVEHDVIIPNIDDMFESKIDCQYALNTMYYEYIG